MLVVDNDIDRGVCRRPWHLFVLGKADRPLYVTSNRCIPIKNILGRNSVVFCACEIIQLFSVAFCVVRAVHIFNFRLVINEISNKWRPV